MIGKVIVLISDLIPFALLQVSHTALRGDILRVNLEGFFQEDLLFIQVINNCSNPDPDIRVLGFLNNRVLQEVQCFLHVTALCCFDSFLKRRDHKFSLTVLRKRSNNGENSFVSI